MKYTLFSLKTLELEWDKNRMGGRGLWKCMLFPVSKNFVSILYNGILLCKDKTGIVDAGLGRVRANFSCPLGSIFYGLRETFSFYSLLSFQSTVQTLVISGHPFTAMSRLKLLWVVRSTDLPFFLCWYWHCLCKVKGESDCWCLNRSQAEALNHVPHWCVIAWKTNIKRKRPIPLKNVFDAAVKIN